VSRELDARVCVGGALFRGTRLLVLRRVDRRRARWDLPGGSVVVGETLPEALRREFREETGLSVRVGRPFDVSSFDAADRTGRGVTVVAVEYFCTSRSRSEPRLSPTEHDAYAWVGVEELRRVRFAGGFGRIASEAFTHRAAATGT
jgi:8-oxo-dGTP diphosphatase